MARIRKSASGSFSSWAAVSASRSSSIAADGSLPQASATARVVVAWTSWDAGDRVAGARDLDRVAGQPLRLGEDAVEHLQLGERGEHRGPFGARFARDELDRPSRREHRPGGVPGGAPDMGQPLVEEAERDAIAPGVETADRRFEIGRRPRHLADREGRLRGTDLEVDPVRRVWRLPPGGPGRWRALGERERQLQGGELVGGGVAIAGERCRLDGRDPRPLWVVADQPVPGDGRRRSAQALRQGRVIAGPGDRQQVACHGTSDRCVAEGDDVVALDQEAVGERLAAAGPQVGVEHALAGSRPCHGAWRGPVGVDLERGGDSGQLIRSERPVGKRQQAQDPAALA